MLYDPAANPGIVYGRVTPTAFPEAVPDQEISPVPVPATSIDPVEVPHALGPVIVPAERTGALFTTIVVATEVFEHPFASV